MLPELCRAAVQLLSRIKMGGLATTFLDSEARFAPILKTFPLFVVLNENVGLLGCRQYALKLLVRRSLKHPLGSPAHQASPA